jgi:GDPmannose 4,6-dehydratase
VISINPEFLRPKDVDVLIGDSSKAQKKLGWVPSTTFSELVKKMCTYDYHLQSPDQDVRKKADEFIF